MSKYSFDLEEVARIIVYYQYKCVILQFPDDKVDISVHIYDRLINLLQSSDNVSLYITADSSWNSSVDDVSAMHCNADMIVYFGSDLSSSCNIPMVIVPSYKHIKEEMLLSILKEVDSGFCGSGNDTDVILFYDVNYSNDILSYAMKLKNHDDRFIIAKLPWRADLKNWSPNHGISKDDVVVGGLEVNSGHLDSQNTKIVYIGENSNQLLNILLRFGDRSVYWGHPVTGCVKVLIGSSSREFQERYACSLKVKAARTIGFIVGTMGFTAELTTAIVNRLEWLVAAAKKKSYCIVIGKLNESKLCNFPEIDVFCLISNDDCAMVKPKTFPVPVITPFELELGLGARDWTSSFSTDLGYLLSGGETELKLAMAKVSQMFSDKTGVECEGGDGENSEGKGIGEELLVGNSANSLGSYTPPSTVARLPGNTIAALNRSDHGNNHAVEYFRNRKYQGLVPDASISAEEDLSIRSGLFGIARQYERLT